MTLRAPKRILALGRAVSLLARPSRPPGFSPRRLEEDVESRFPSSGWIDTNLHTGRCDRAAPAFATPRRRLVITSTAAFDGDRMRAHALGEVVMPITRHTPI